MYNINDPIGVADSESMKNGNDVILCQDYEGKEEAIWLAFNMRCILLMHIGDQAANVRDLKVFFKLHMHNML